MVLFSLIVFTFLASLVIAIGTIVSDEYFKTNKTITWISGILFLGSLFLTITQSANTSTPFPEMMAATIFITLATLAHRTGAFPPASQGTVVEKSNLEVAHAPRVKVKPHITVSEKVYQVDAGGEVIHSTQLEKVS